MFMCPHCQEKGVTTLGKFWSHKGGPAYCKYCGEPSYQLSGSFYKKWLNDALLVLHPFVAIILLMITGSIELMFAIIAVSFPTWLGIEILALYKRPLVKTELAHVKRSQWKILVILLAILGYAAYMAVAPS